MLKGQEVFQIPHSINTSTLLYKRVAYLICISVVALIQRLGETCYLRDPRVDLFLYCKRC